jgi:hypothetical protein
MTSWLKRNLPDLGDWRLSSSENACKEAEMAYLFNDIGPLIYVQGLARQVEQSAQE